MKPTPDKDPFPGAVRLDEDLNNRFFNALVYNKADIVRAILREHPHALHARDYRQHHPILERRDYRMSEDEHASTFCAAARYCDTDLVEELAAMGADIHACQIKAGNALHAAVGNVNMTQKLLEMGVSPNVQDHQGRTPFDQAIAMYDAKTARFYHAAGFKPAISAAEHLKNFSFFVNDPDTLTFIIRDLGGCVNTALRSAINARQNGGHYYHVKSLLDMGANPNIPDNDGNTALHIFALHVREGYDPIQNRALDKIIEPLKQKGANPLIRNNAGKTALDILESRAKEFSGNSNIIDTIAPVLRTMERDMEQHLTEKNRHRSLERAFKIAHQGIPRPIRAIRKITPGRKP